MRKTTCSDCGAERDGSSVSYCKQCACRRQEVWRQKNYGKTQLTMRKTHLKRTYGLTVEEYEAKRNAQCGRCAICAADDAGVPGHSFYVDHDHTTGENRDLLCANCNRVLGWVCDDITTLRAMIRYLERHGVVDPLAELVM